MIINHYYYYHRSVSWGKNKSNESDKALIAVDPGGSPEITAID